MRSDNYSLSGRGVSMPNTYVAGTLLTCEHEHCGCRILVQEQCNCEGSDDSNYTCGCGAKLVRAPE